MNPSRRKFLGKFLFVVLLLLVGPGRVHGGPAVLAEWNFNDPSSLAPSSGDGALTLLGGVAGTNFLGAASDGGQPNGALSLSKFPPKGQAAQSAGLELRVPTAGATRWGVRFEIRASGTASQRLRLLVAAAADGPFLDVGMHEITKDGTFAPVEFSLADFSELEGAEELWIRLVSDFGDVGEYVGVKAKTDGSNSYSPAGAWRFDLLTVTGEPADAPTGPVPLQITAGEEGLTLTWPEHPGRECSVWGAAGPDGPWEPVATGLTVPGHTEPWGEGPRFFRVTAE